MGSNVISRNIGSNWKAKYCYRHERCDFLSSHWYRLFHHQRWLINCHTTMDSWHLLTKKLARSFLPLKRSCWLGLKEYQVRDKKSLIRHFILVFCAYTFILWHQMTGGLRRRWANKPLNTFPEALEAFRTAMTRSIFRLVDPQPWRVYCL